MKKFKSTRIKFPEINIANRKIGKEHPPLVIAEIGINHSGDMKKARQMVRDAHSQGAEIVKFQTHIIEDEMVESIAKKIIPKHVKESIWDIMQKCAFSEEQEQELKAYVENMGMIYLSTPFSRAAADRLQRMGVKAYKIGSGECNNYPIVEHIARFGKPVILSSGMNNIPSIKVSVNILRKYKVPYAILHCTSMYPTPYPKVRLGALEELQTNFPDAVVGLSDHSLGNYTCFAAAALGASILEKHFTSSKNWRGADISISIDPQQLKELIVGSKAIFEARGGTKNILPDEKDVINFAYACVVTIQPISKGEFFTKKNLWVKRPGTGQIKAEEYNRILNHNASRNLPKDIQLKYSDITNYTLKKT